MTILSGLVDIGAVASGVVLTGLALASVLTAGAALAAAGEIIAILGATVVVVGVLEGVHERNVSVDSRINQSTFRLTGLGDEKVNSRAIPQATAGQTDA